jgi:hypothetical protein
MAQPGGLGLLSEGASATAERIRQELGLVALDTSDPFDRRVREEVDYLDWGYNLVQPNSGKTQVRWFRPGANQGTLASPDEGLVLNRNEIKGIVDSLKRRYGDQEAEAVVYIAALAHERAHLAQFKYYGGYEEFLVAHPAKVIEVQADIIAGTWMGGKIFNPSILTIRPDQWNEAQSRMKRFIQASQDAMTLMGAMGEAKGDHHHGNSDQRNEAFGQGTLLGMITWMRSVPDLPQELVDYRFGAEQRIDFHYGQEKMMEWSLKQAYRLSGLRQPTRGTAPSQLSEALASLITASRNFGDIRGDKDTEGSDEDVDYYSAINPVPGALETVIHIDKADPNDSYVVVNCFRGSSQESDAARQAFHSWDAAVTAALPQGYTREDRSARAVRSTSFKRIGSIRWRSMHGRTVRLEFNEWPRTGLKVDLYVDEQG